MLPPNSNHGNGNNGRWSSWVLGIVAGLILIAIVGSIIFERDVAKTLGEHEVQIKYMADRINEKTLDRFTRSDFEREMKVRDAIMSRLERKNEILEQRIK